MWCSSSWASVASSWRPDAETERLAWMYLWAIDELRTKDGGLWFGFSREEPLPYRATGDQLTRTLWGLGLASVHGVDDQMRTHAQRLFEELLPLMEEGGYEGPIRLTYAMQGLSLFIQVQPEHTAARKTLSSGGQPRLVSKRGGHARVCATAPRRNGDGRSLRRRMEAHR